MTGSSSAMMSVGIGTVIGMIVQEKHSEKQRFLQSMDDLLGIMMVLLAEENLGLVELCLMSAKGLANGVIKARMECMGHLLQKDPLCEPIKAYAQACQTHPMRGEGMEAQDILQGVFGKWYVGAMEMRKQTIITQRKRLEPLLAKAKANVQVSAKLSVQVGMLIGAMVGIMLW